MAHNLSPIGARPWAWRPGETVTRMSTAVLNGTPHINMIHRVTLLIYVRSLSQGRLERSDARVFLSAQECASKLDAETREIRWHLQNLQSAGYLIDLTRVRRSSREVYDLSPTLAQLEAFEDAAAASGRPPAGRGLAL
jgi:hypothetical protein